MLATFLERLSEAPWVVLRLVGTLAVVFVCCGLLGFIGQSIWAVLTKRLHISGIAIVACILGFVSLWVAWGAVQYYAQARAVEASGVSPDPNVPIEQVCRSLNGSARGDAFIAAIIGSGAIWLVWQWSRDAEHKRLLNMTERERLIEKAKDVMDDSAF